MLSYGLWPGGEGGSTRHPRWVPAPTNLPMYLLLQAIGSGGKVPLLTLPLLRCNSAPDNFRRRVIDVCTEETPLIVQKNSLKIICTVQSGRAVISTDLFGICCRTCVASSWS